MILCLLCWMADWSASEVELLKTLRIREPAADSTNRFATSRDAAEFGQQLFFDSHLSQSGSMSCATCHIPQLAFSDGKPLAAGLSRHTPTLVNVAFQSWFFWDGRRDSLWSQALEPIQNPKEMAASLEHLVEVVANDPCYRSWYHRLFGDLKDQEPLSIAVNCGKAIAAFEAHLVSQPAPFDRFIDALVSEDDQAANAILNEDEQAGLKLFIGPAGCVRCHFGPALSDGQFHRIGVPDGEQQLIDQGRFGGLSLLASHRLNANSIYSDDRQGYSARRLELLEPSDQQWGQFRTPTLRMIALTAPYMHRGQFADLASVIHFYNTREQAVRLGHHDDPLLQPLGLSAQEQQQLMAFLGTLTGHPESEWLSPPSKCDGQHTLDD